MNIADMLLSSNYTIYIKKDKMKDELVGTKIKVTKIEKLSKPPVPFKIRKVAWKV